MVSNALLGSRLNQTNSFSQKAVNFADDPPQPLSAANQPKRTRIVGGPLPPFTGEVSRECGSKGEATRQSGSFSLEAVRWRLTAVG